MKTYSRLIAMALMLLAGSFTAGAQIVVPGSAPKKPDPPVHLSKKEKAERDKSLKRPPPPGSGFAIETVTGGPHILYTILLSDADNRSVPGNFIRQQIDIFKALLEAASQFAETPEEAGTAAAPKTTRFVDRHEPAFIIDVQKSNLESRFFVTMQTVLGKLTVDAGAIRRGAKAEGQEPLLYLMISRIQEAINPPPQ